MTSFPMEVFVILMAFGLIFSIITGVVMAFQFGRGRIALLTLATGLFVPLLLIGLFGS